MDLDLGHLACVARLQRVAVDASRLLVELAEVVFLFPRLNSCGILRDGPGRGGVNSAARTQSTLPNNKNARIAR